MPLEHFGTRNSLKISGYAMNVRQALLDNAAPPAYDETINPQSTSVQDQAQPGYPVQGKSGYPPQPGYTPQIQPGYPPAPQGQSGHPPQGHPGYPPQGHPGYPPQGQTWYPLQQQQPCSTTTTNVTVVQTGYPVIAVFPSDNSGLAWFTCLCCFWPLGIAAIVFSHRARDAIDSGDLASAISLSSRSRTFSYWAIGIHIFLLIAVPIIIGAIFGSMSGA